MPKLESSLGSFNINLLKNYLLLGLIQLANFLPPLLVVPYISRIIGPNNLGEVNYALSFVTFLSLFVTFGFDYTSSREAILHRGEVEFLSKQFTYVALSRLYIFILTFVLEVLVILLFSKMFNLYYLLTLSIINIGLIFNPQWFYQSLENMKLFTGISIVIKVLFSFSFFYFVKIESDAIWYCLIFALSQAVPNMILFILAIVVNKLTLVGFFDWRYLFNCFKSGFSVFLSFFFINLYTTLNTLILGWYCTSYSVGIFTSAIKLISIINIIIMAPLGFIFFPKIGSNVQDSPKNAIRMVDKLILIVTPIMGLIGAILFVFSEEIVLLIYGIKYIESAKIVKMCCFIPLLVGISNILGIQALINFKKDKLFLIVTAIAACLSLILNVFLVPRFSEIGSSLAWLLIEIFVTISFGYIYLYHVRKFTL